MPDGTRAHPGGWNRFAIEVDGLEPLVDALRAAGAHFRNDIVTGVGGRRSWSTTPRAMPSSSSSRSCPRRNCRPPSAPPRTVGGPVVSAHPDIHPDLEAEQAYIVAAYDHLAAMQGRTSVVFEKALDDARRGDVNADAQAMHLGKRLAQLDVGGLALCFGRIDEEAARARSTSAAATSRTPRGDPVVVDWRAPRRRCPSTGRRSPDPFGLKRRRRFSIEGASTCSTSSTRTSTTRTAC